MDGTTSDIAAIVGAIRRERRGRTLLLISAFDGTLTGYEADPRRIVLAGHVGNELRRIARHAPAKLVIVSGRRLFDIRRRAETGNDSFYIGLHGLEIYGPSVAIVRGPIRYPRRLLQRLARTLEGFTWELPGVWVEDKDVAIALHTRAASRQDAALATGLLLQLASPSIATGHLRLVRGNRVVELIPNVSWTKLDGLRRIIATIEQSAREPVFPVCIGDDAADQDLFRGLGARSTVTIAVGRRRLNARFQLADHGEVATLLHRLAERHVRAA